MSKSGFNDIADNPIQQAENLYGSDVLDNISKMQVGFGAKSFKADESGIFLGANKFADAPFSVDMDGNVIASKATLTGYGKNFVSTLVWTSVSHSQATWSSGTIKTSDGVSYSIASGSSDDVTGDIYYYYLDPATSITVLQETSTATTAAGNGKILIAIVTGGSGAGVKCIIDVVGGVGTTIDGDKIVTGKIQSADGNTFFDLDGDQIQIQDGSSTTIIDSTGLVSSANFPSDSVENASARTYSNAATYADIANTSITTSSLARSTEVLILYTVNVIEFPINGTTAFAGKVTLRIDSTDQTANNFELQLTSQSPIANTSAWGGPLTAVGIVTLASGTHTLKLRAQTINTNSQLNVNTTSLVYIILGS